MRVFLFLFLLTLNSCQSHKRTESKSKVVTQGKNEVPIPTFIQDHLNSYLHGWQVAPRSNWADSILRKYHTDTTEINYVLGDINCDGKTDFTGILKDSIGNFATFQIYSLEQYYASQQLETYPNNNISNIGLKLIDSKTPFEYYDGPPETFSCGAIQRFNMDNKGKMIFYQNRKGFFEISVAE